LPSGTVIRSVFEDRSGNRFIYHDSMPGAQPFTAAEVASNPPLRRFYFPPGHPLRRK